MLVTFLAAAYRLVQQTLIHAGADQAQATANQVAGLLWQSTEQRLTDAHRIASDETMRTYAKAPTQQGRAAATQLLQAFTIAGQQSALWVRGTRQLIVRDQAAHAAGVATIPDIDVLGGIGVSPLRADGNVSYYDAIAAVMDPGADPLGYVVLRRAVSAPQTAGILRGLVGKGARLKMGNRDGGAWTDWSAVVVPPPIDLNRSGLVDYRGTDGAVVGSLSLVANTPWAVWVEFSQDALLAPARGLLGRLLAITVACVVLAALLIAVVSARITTPLHALTVASEAIVAGDYTQRVVRHRADEIGRLGLAFNAMSAHVQAAHEDLEQRVQKRTDELEAASKQLEAFSYSVSHDLRAPLRAISGFSGILITEHLDALPADAASHLRRIAEGARQMGQLVDDLLAFARLGRASVRRVCIDPAAIARDVLGDLEGEHAGRDVRLSVAPMPSCDADPALLKQVYANLLSNALKFTRARPDASVDVGCRNGGDSEPVYFVKDNGVGFDMRYADKLFGVFQRLHRAEDYEGTGVGLAIVERIVSRHGGRVWAEASPDQGACFYFTIGSPA